VCGGVKRDYAGGGELKTGQDSAMERKNVSNPDVEKKKVGFEKMERTLTHFDRGKKGIL